jgi:hypothetical protein
MNRYHFEASAHPLTPRFAALPRRSRAPFRASPLRAEAIQSLRHLQPVKERRERDALALLLGLPSSCRQAWPGVRAGAAAGCAAAAPQGLCQQQRARA